nr:hypothetical protein [Tanacetum cinerariifolium]
MVMMLMAAAEVDMANRGGCRTGDGAVEVGDGVEWWLWCRGAGGGDVDVTVATMATVVVAAANKGGSAWRRWVVDLIDRDTGSHFGAKVKAVQYAAAAQAKIVKDRFSTKKPTNFSDEYLLYTLKAMFGEIDEQDALWRNQRSVYGLALVKRWKLLTSCGVHVIILSTVQLFLLVERSTPISAAKPKTLKIVAAAPAVSTRKRKGVVIRDPEEELHNDTPAKTPTTREEMEKEDEEIIKSINETPAHNAAKRRKLSEEAQEADDLKKRLEIVQDEDDDVFVEATPLDQKVPVVDYQVVVIDNKPRLGHVNFKTINKLVKGNLVRGLPSKVFTNDNSCVACRKGKQHRASCKSKTVFFLASKDETPSILKAFIVGLENLLSLKVKIIRCDNGTEFKNSDLNQFCGLKGIKREFSVPRTPQQNRIAERKNRTLIEAARTLLADSLLPISFWAEAVNTACYVQNRVLVTKPHNKTPYELLHGRLPSIGFMRPFGCPVTILNTLDPLGKFQRKVDEGFLVGYFVCREDCWVKSFINLCNLSTELVLLKRLKENTKCVSAANEELTAAKHKLMLLI